MACNSLASGLIEDNIQRILIEIEGIKMAINTVNSWPTLDIPKLRAQDIPKNTLKLKTLKGMEKIDCEVFSLYVCGILLLFPKTTAD